MRMRQWRARELPTDEFWRLRGVPPYDQLPDGVLPDPRARIIVVERADVNAEGHGAWAIVRHWAAFNAVHLEPLWSDEAERGNPATAKALLAEMKRVLDEDRVTAAFAIIADADEPSMRTLVARAGFTKLPGALYTVARAIPGIDQEG